MSVFVVSAEVITSSVFNYFWSISVSLRRYLNFINECTNNELIISNYSCNLFVS